MLGDVEDPLLPVVERGADVQALPDRQVLALGSLGGQAQGGADAVEVAAQFEGGGGEDHRAVGEELLAQQAGDRERCHPQGRPEAVVAFVPDHVVLGAVGDALGDGVDVLHRGEGLFADRVLVLDGFVPGGAERGDDRTGGVPQRHQAVAEVLGDLLQAAGQGQLHQPLEGLGGGLELVGGLFVDEFGGPADGAADLARGELPGGDAGDPGDQLMGLVDDQDLVLREDRGALDGVDGQQRVVGDHHIGEFGALPGGLREALRSVGALGGAQALPGGDGDLAPGAVGDPGGERIAVAGFGLVRPVAQPQQVLAELAGGRRLLEDVEQALLLVLRGALVQTVQAQIVGAALEHGELGAAAQLGMERLDRPRQIALHQLALEGEGGRGDHHSLAVGQRRHQIAEGLSGAGAGLDQQMGGAVHGLGDGLGHRHLAGALGAADGGHGGMEQIGEGGLRHSVCKPTRDH